MPLVLPKKLTKCISARFCLLFRCKCNKWSNQQMRSFLSTNVNAVASANATGVLQDDGNAVTPDALPGSCFFVLQFFENGCLRDRRQSLKLHTDLYILQNSLWRRSSNVTGQFQNAKARKFTTCWCYLFFGVFCITS